MCLQGASAVQRVLEQQSDEHMRVFIIWEPVLVTDWAAPSSSSLRRIHDSRVQQYWDKGRLLSRALGEKDRSSIVWDRVSVYPAGAIWQPHTPPQPLFEDGPVVDVIPALTETLRQAEPRR